MHNDEIKKALFPKDVALEELNKKYAGLATDRNNLLELVRELKREAHFYRHLKDIGVVITTEEGAKYLIGDDMDAYLGENYGVLLHGFGNAPIKGEGQSVEYDVENTR